MSACFQINIVVGILRAYSSNLVLATRHLGGREWRWDFGVASVPVMLFLAMLFSIPQSPRWLGMKSRVAEALDTLTKIGAPEPEIELQQMLDAIHVNTFEQKEPLFQKRYFMPILLAFHIAVFNQCSGINAVLYYLNDIFVSAGFSRLSGNLAGGGRRLCQLDLHTRSNGADRSSRPQNAAADPLCGHDGRARYDCLSFMVAMRVVPCSPS